QTPDGSDDGDPATSEGIAVFTSGAPAVAIGDFVTVSGSVQEFIPSADPASPPKTEIVSPVVSIVSSGNPLPVPVTIAAADTDPHGPIDQLERLEGMRVRVDALTVTAPTQRRISEASASVNGNGAFYGVLPGVARPFRQPGGDVPDPLLAAAPAGSP